MKKYKFLIVSLYIVLCGCNSSFPEKAMVSTQPAKKNTDVKNGQSQQSDMDEKAKTYKIIGE